MKRYTLDEKEWLIKNYASLGYKKCMERLGRSKASVCQTAIKLGVQIPLSLRNKRHSETLINKFTPTILPETFANVNTKEIAYVLGILWAEGWIQANSDYSVNIKMIEEDFIEILPIFYTLGEWKQYRYSPKNRKPTIQLRVSGKSLVDFFLTMNYQTKSNYPATKILSIIPESLKKYWWRGYFDGDGHIHSSHPYRIQFTSSWDQDWSFLPNIPFHVYVTRGKHSYSKAMIWKKSEIIQFGTMIWKDWDGIGLSRKYNEFSKLI